METQDRALSMWGERREKSFPPSAAENTASHSIQASEKRIIPNLEKMSSGFRVLAIFIQTMPVLAV